MSHETTHPSLLARLRCASDTLAWRDFDRRYGALIMRYCARRGLQQSDAEDVRQVVMMSLTQTMPAFRYDPSLGRFRDYLGRTVTHAIIRHRQRQGRELSLDHQVSGQLPAAEEDAWRREWMLHHYRQALRVVREDVDARSIEVFECLLCGETVDETAGRFSMTTAAVYKIKQRIRDRLRRQILRQLCEEDAAP
jgi:RNA polymerase sigma factor (sigma-70 family)